MNSNVPTISNYTHIDTGPPATVPPRRESSFLPHNYYVSMVISELCVLDKTTYRLSICAIMDRIDHLINFVHDEQDLRSVTSTYFEEEANVREVLASLEDSGLLRIEGNDIELTASQLDYIRDYLLDFYHIDR